MLFLNPGGEIVVSSFDILKVFTVKSILFICHWFLRDTSVKEVSEKISPALLGIFWAVMFFLIAVAQGSGEQFIYFQF